MHDARVAAAREQRLVETDRAADVGVEGLVDRRVERDRRRAVDDDVEILRAARGSSRARPRRCGSASSTACSTPASPTASRQALNTGLRSSVRSRSCAADAALGAHEQRDRGLADARRAGARARPARRIRCLRSGRRARGRGRSPRSAAVTEPSLAFRVGADAGADARERGDAGPRSVRPPRDPPAPPNTKVSKKVRSSAGDSSGADRPGRAGELAPGEALRRAARRRGGARPPRRGSGCGAP